MNLIGNTLIYFFRAISMAIVFFIALFFVSSSIKVAENDYISEKSRLAENMQIEHVKYTKLPDFSFFSIAQAVEIDPEYLKQKELSLKKTEKKKSVKIPKTKKIKKYTKRKISSKSGYYRITGYQAVAAQTDSTPNIAAWNDNIKNAVNVAAVTQNSGFKRGTCLKISGLPETYIVLDYFNKRYNGQKKIDILVGSKAQAHKITGKRKVTVFAPGSCALKRMVNGKATYEKLRKKRF